MDLHVARLPEGGVADRPVLAPDDLAERYARAADVGVGWNRWSVYWDMIERDSGPEWAAADGIVSRDVAAGLATLAILQGTPPRHAAVTAAVPGDHVPAVGGGPLAWRWMDGAVGPSVLAAPPRGLSAPVFLDAAGAGTDDPELAHGVNPGSPWARFVAAAVERYRPGGVLATAAGWPADAGVRAWEIGNEPNLSHFWSGTPEQYARYLEVAHLVIAWLDPEAVVLHGGIADTTGADAWFRAFLSALLERSRVSPLPERHGYYFHATAWHWYTYPALLAVGPVRARRLLAEHGLPDKPVWVTELGVPIWDEHPGPCWDPLSPWRATTVEQAAYVWLATAEALSAGVEVLVFFQAYDDCGNGPESYDAFGFVRNHAANRCWAPRHDDCWQPKPSLSGVPRPAYFALEAAVRELAGAELLWRPPAAQEGWERVLFYRPPDKRVTVAWNWRRTAQTVEVGATGREGSVVTIGPDGGVLTRVVRPEAGLYRLDLAGATNRNNPGNHAAVMAGRPVMLVETDTVMPFRANVEALPAVSGTPLTLTVAAADGGTGVGAFQVFASTEPPDRQPQWRAVTPELDWPALPRGGQARVSFRGEPGRGYGFAARARDRAGNWTVLPHAPQAYTVVAGAAAGSPTAPPTGTPSATAMPAPSPTRAPPDPDRVFLPVGVNGGGGRGAMDTRGAEGGAYVPSRAGRAGASSSMRSPAHVRLVCRGVASTSASASLSARRISNREAGPPYVPG